MNMAAAIEPHKLIPVTLVEGETRQCPYVSWFRFKTCTIKTCKNFTDKTASKCLAIDREAPTGNKVISDAEIHLFKFHNDNVSTRLVSMRRKKAVDRVKCILALHGFIEHLKAKYTGEERKGWFIHPLLTETRAKYPLKIKRLGFENWMWPFIVSKREYKLFANHGRGECAEFGIHELLAVEQQELEQLRKAIASTSQ